MTEATSDATSSSPDTGGYFAALGTRLGERGIESNRANRAIHHLEHGLAGERTPVEHYGPVDHVSDALAEAFSAHGRRLYGFVLAMASCAAVVFLTTLIALRDRADTNLVFNEGAQLPFAADDRVLNPMALGALAFAPALAYLASGGSGYLLARWPGNGVGTRERTGFQKRSVRLQRMMRVVSLSLALFLILQAAMWVVFPPNYGDSYLVTPQSLQLLLVASVVVGVPASLSYLRHRRVQVDGRVKYLLRDPDDTLYDAPGRVPDSQPSF